ncbi:uncharacterized protein TrAtP1_000133 [Trichoderma atroviride]|nr:hypothetical protein TrAtP1_000133 [Trichoderma atroviride]
MLGAGGYNDVWEILRVDSGVCVEKVNGRNLQNKPTFTHDSALVVIKDGAAEIWHPDGRQSVQDLSGLGSQPYQVCAACFSADFTLAAGILDDGSLRIWKMNTGECMREVKSAVPYNSYDPTTLCFSSDASRIAYASDKETELFVWQVGLNLPAQKFGSRGNVCCFALSNTKVAAVISSKDVEIRIWSLETGRESKRLHGVRAQILVFSFDSTLLATFSTESVILESRYSQEPNTILIWNADTGACLQSINVGLQVTHLFFELNNNSGLRTNLGRIKFGDSTALGEDATGVNQSQLWSYDKLGYRNDDQGVDASWITFNGENLLWLPAKYRGRRQIVRAVSESVVAIAHVSSGQLVIIGFDTEKIPRWYHNTHKYFISQRTLIETL